MSVPSRVIAIDGEFATVEAFGVTRTCSLMLLAEPVAIGDYLVLGAGGGFAADIVPEETALAALSYLAEVLEAGEA
jgi:hydrogenase expression/formation protein HypC